MRPLSSSPRDLAEKLAVAPATIVMQLFKKGIMARAFLSVYSPAATRAAEWETPARLPLIDLCDRWREGDYLGALSLKKGFDHERPQPAHRHGPREGQSSLFGKHRQHKATPDRTPPNGQFF